MKTLLRGLALALLLWLVACDAPLFEPESITVPSTTAPPVCRGNGRNACPPDPALPKLDSAAFHPLNASMERGMTLQYWPIGWYGGQPYTCFADGDTPLGRIRVDAAWLESASRTVWTPLTVGAPALADAVVVPDLFLCTGGVEFDDPSVVEWQPRSWLSAVSAWVMGLFA